MKYLQKKTYLFIFFFSLLFFIFIYRKNISYFFIQDDYFEINISKASKLEQYRDFYKFRNDIIAYRPITLQNYFFISSKIFGFNPVGFRLISYSALLLSAAIIVKVIKDITKNKNSGLLAASLWITSSIHFMSLSWIAAAYNIIGTFFWLLTSLFFLEYIKSAEKRFYLLTLILFLVTVGSFEFSVTWPIIFSFYYLFILKKKATRTFKLFLPFFLISIAYIILRKFLIVIPPINEYKFTFNLDSIRAYIWYFFWTLNIPEEFKKQAIKNLVFLNPKFFEEYWQLVLFSTSSAIFIFTSGLIFPLLKILNRINAKILGFCIIWFSVAISPVLLLPNHTFSMYLTLASIGFYMMLSYLLVIYNKNFLTGLVLAVWFFSSFTTLRFYEQNYWIIESQKFSKDFSLKIKKELPYIPANSSVYYYLPDKRHQQSLLESNAIRAIYNDPSITIYYNKEELLKDYKIHNYKKPVYIFAP